MVPGGHKNALRAIDTEGGMIRGTTSIQRLLAKDALIGYGMRLYPIALTVEFRRSLLGPPFQCAALGMYSNHACVPPRTLRRLSGRNAMEVLVPGPRLWG